MNSREKDNLYLTVLNGILGNNKENTTLSSKALSKLKKQIENINNMINKEITEKNKKSLIKFLNTMLEESSTKEDTANQISQQLIYTISQIECFDDTFLKGLSIYAKTAKAANKILQQKTNNFEENYGSIYSSAIKSLKLFMDNSGLSKIILQLKIKVATLQKLSNTESTRLNELKIGLLNIKIAKLEKFNAKVEGSFYKNSNLKKEEIITKVDHHYNKKSKALFGLLLNNIEVNNINNQWNYPRIYHSLKTKINNNPLAKKYLAKAWIEKNQAVEDEYTRLAICRFFQAYLPEDVCNLIAKKCKRAVGGAVAQVNKSSAPTAQPSPPFSPNLK